MHWGFEVSKSYAELQKQIEALKKEAEAVRAKEVAGVLARIREAIDHYGLTPADLFGTGMKDSSRQSSSVVSRVPVKYRDGAGNVWSGRGPRPAWFKAALQAGKQPEEFLVK